jgi:hypothetical protein
MSRTEEIRVAISFVVALFCQQLLACLENGQKNEVNG